MPTLSSLIVQREIATMRTVEEAIARQVLHGGDLATNLMEVAVVSEQAVGRVLAEAFGLDPAPPGKLPAPAAYALRAIPGELALRHGIFPLSRDPELLVVATSAPLPSAVEEDFSFALGVDIRQVAAPLVRIRQAIAEHYALPLDRRFLRLVARLEGRPDPSPSSLPPGGRVPGPVKLPLPASVPPVTFGTGGIGAPPMRAPIARTPRVAAPDEPVALPEIPRAPPPLHAPDDEPTLGEEVAATAMEPSPSPAFAAPASEPVVVDGGAVMPGGRHPTPAPFEGITFAEPELPGGGSRSHVDAEAPFDRGAGQEGGPREAGAADAGQALAGWARRAAEAERRRPPGSQPPEGARAARSAMPMQQGRARGRRKGPLTAAMAEEELEQAASTDGVLATYFAYAHQFFHYAVLFVVQGDLAEGRDAAGPGADRARVAGIGVPLDLPSILSLARDRRAPLIAPLSMDGLDAELARDLGRVKVGARGSSAVVIPVVVRSRAVALLYGDDGDDDVELEAIGEVLAFTGLVAGALERTILRKKLGPRAAPGPVVIGRLRRAGEAARAAHRPAGREGAAVLAKALAPALPGPGDPAPPPVERSPAAPQVSPIAESIRPDLLAERMEPGGPLAARDLLTAPPGEPAAGHGSGPGVQATVSPAAESTRAGAADARVPPAAPLPDDLDDEDSDESLNRAISRVVEAPPPLPNRISAPPSDAPPRDEAVDQAAPAARPPPLPPVDERKMTLRGFAPPGVPTSRPPPAPAVDVPAPPGSQRRGPAPPLPHRGRTPQPPDVLPTSPPANATSLPVPPVPVRAPTPPAFERPSEAPRVGRTIEGIEYPLTPPPPTAAAVRALPRTPIPREEMEDAETIEVSPDGAEVLVAAEPSPSPGARVEDDGRIHPPPHSRGGARQASPLPTVIVDVAAEYASLLERLLAGGPGSDEAFAELVKSGEQTLPSIVARFPGPLRVDRHRARDHLPAASQCGPILELVVAMRRLALPFVTVRTTSPDPDVRFWATHSLGELRYPEASNAVLPRLFDDEPSVRRVARRAAASLVSAGAAGQPVLVGLDHLTRNTDEAIPRRVLAIETMGEIRVGQMVPPLVAVLSDPSEEVADTARRALLLITRQDFGRDAKRWLEWWTKNGSRHRIEWLVDALMHEVPSIRRAAGDELKSLTKEYFGYYDDLPKKERERAQGRYREWWEREGRERFRP